MSQQLQPCQFAFDRIEPPNNRLRLPKLASAPRQHQHQADQHQDARPMTECNIGSQPRILAAKMQTPVRAIATCPITITIVDEPSSSSERTSRIASNGDKWLAL